MTQPSKRVEEIVEEIVSNCVDCIYGMNIDCSMKEAKRLYTELENSPLLKKQITTTLTQLEAEKQQAVEEREMNYTDIRDKDYPTYQTYYGAVTNNPLFQMWREVAEQHGIDAEESVETGWMGDEHFAKFLEWVVNLDSLEEFFILAYPDLREITFHSNGDVIIKTGANAENPKKLYKSYPPKNSDGTLKEQPNWTKQIKIAIHKLLQDKEKTLTTEDNQK